MSTKFGEFTILELVEELVGRIKPVKDTLTDGIVERNLEKWAYITDVMVERLAEVANMNVAGYYSAEKVKHKAEIAVENLSDGYHTFKSLYNQRMILSVALFNSYPELAWKSKKHEDGQPCFGGGWFIVGIHTPKGDYTYHYKDEYWDLFKCKELETAPHWDGHTEEDVERLLSLLNNKEEG